MKIHQLRYLCAIVDHQLNVTRAAETLHTSQPGISRQIRLLEEELGTALFERRRTKLIRLSPAGNAAVLSARRMLLEAETMRSKIRVADERENQCLVIATTQTHARYVVLPAFKTFRKRHPEVSLELQYASPNRSTELVGTGKVDIGIATEPPEAVTGIAYLLHYRLSNSIVVPARHPLLRLRRLRMENIGKYPIITYDVAFRFGREVRESFRAHNIIPNIVINSINSDITKAYVEAGLGIAILPSIVCHPRRDMGLRTIAANHLFEPRICHVMALEGRTMEGYQLDFIAELRAVARRI